MGTAADNLIDQAAHRDSSDEFYWAIGEHMKACRGTTDHLNELESAMQWCIDHEATINFGPPINIIFKYLVTSDGPIVTKVIHGEKFLDVVEYAKDFLERLP